MKLCNAPVSLCLAGLLTVTSGEAADAQFRDGFHQTPKREDADLAWPAAARAAGVEGEATAVCKVGPNGVLSDCQVISETPDGAGFGQALLSLAPKFRAKSMGSRGCGAYFHHSLIGWSWRSLDRYPDWRAAPWAGRLTDYYPVEALKSLTRGSAVVQCTVQVSGSPTDCRATFESPSDQGFGEAAVAMAATFRFRPAKSDKEPVSSAVAIPISFIPTSGPILNCRG